MILYDTDTCSELLRGNQAVIEKHHASDEIIGISFMTVGELYYGAIKSNHAEKNVELVDQFIHAIHIIHSDQWIMNLFGRLKAQLSKLGRILPDADIIIAATAIIHCSKLISGNTAHFARFEDLNQENWMNR